MIQLCVYIQGSQVLGAQITGGGSSSMLLKSHSQTLRSACACSVPQLGIDTHPSAWDLGAKAIRDTPLGQHGSWWLSPTSVC